jgi:hypothetical protein
MSSVHLYETAKHRVDLKHHDYGFILVLVCMVRNFCATACW